MGSRIGADHVALHAVDIILRLLHRIHHALLGGCAVRHHLLLALQHVLALPDLKLFKGGQELKRFADL